MINSSDILRFIKDKSIDLPKEELERIIEEELNKPENEMDADLIEYCLDALNELESNDTVEIKAERTSDLKDNRITKPFKKVFAIAAAVAILAVGSLSVFAAVSDVSYTVGNGEEFTRNTYFDNDRGIISASFSETLVDEAAIKVLHTTKNHYGTVSFSTRNSSTNTATAGNWTNRADVKVDSVGTATYRATYY